MHLIILPGWGHNKEHWEAVSRLLTERNCNHTVLDLPGFGSEPYDPSFTTVDDVADWLDQTLQEKFDSAQLILCGHSYGGRVAASYLARHTHHCEKLILIGSPNLYRPAPTTRLKKRLAGILRPLKHFLPENARKALQSDDYKAAAGTELSALLKNVIPDDQAKLLPHIAVPTELIWGEHDDAAPLAIAKEVDALLPNSHLEIVQGGGHNLHLEKPDWLSGRLVSLCKA